MTLTCAGCGTELPPPKRASGRQRKWCSSRCRKVTLYAGSCIDCGARTNGYGGPGMASARCIPCRKRFERESARWTREVIVAAIQRWADEHGGVPPVATDWNTTLAAAPRRAEFPPTGTVQRVFGSWREAILAAGFDAFSRGQYGRDGEDPAVVAETVRLYRSGLSLEAVGRRLGVSGNCVMYRLEKAGEPRRHSWAGLRGAA